MKASSTRAEKNFILMICAFVRTVHQIIELLMAEDIGAGSSPSLHPGNVEHAFQRGIDLQHMASTVQDHHAFDHRGQHGKSWARSSESSSILA